MSKLPGISAAMALVLVASGLFSTAGAQVPNYHQVNLGGAATENLSDTISAYGLTATWTIAANSLVCTFTGVPERASNYILLSWTNPPDGFPLACRVTSATGALYDFEASQDVGGVWDDHLNVGDVSGDFVFGQHFPPLTHLNVAFRPKEIGQTYDMTIQMSWGAGTPVAAKTFGEVKSLYR